MGEALNAGAGLLKRLNNKLGGYGPLPGARPSQASMGGADPFRALGSWERELRDADLGVLSHLTDPASPAFFQNLHRASQERIVVALLRADSAGELTPEVRALVEKLASVEGDKTCWAPRMVGALRDKFELATPPSAGGGGAGVDLLEQEADEICGLLDPVGVDPFCYDSGEGGDSSSSASAGSNTNDMPGHIEDRIVRGMAQLGILRGFPCYSVLAGTGEGDKISAAAYGLQQPGSVQVLTSPNAKLPDGQYPFKLKHPVAFSGETSMGLGGAGQSSRVAEMPGTSAAGGSASGSSSSSSSSSSSTAGAGASAVVAKQGSHLQAAQLKKNELIAAQTDAMLKKMSDATGNSNAPSVSKKRPREGEGGGEPKSGSNPPPAKKQAASDSPPGWDDTNSNHLKRFSDMVTIIDSGRNAERNRKLKEKHKYRLKDFAAYPNHTMGATEGKDHLAIPFQIIKREDGQKRLIALVLYYKGNKAGKFVEKSSTYKKRARNDG